MKVLGNRVFVSRGESFTLLFGDTDEISPVVLASNFVNPFITISFKSMKYPQTGRYTLVTWLDCKKVIRFEETNIMYLGQGNMTDIVIPDDDQGPVENIYKRVYSVSNENDELTYFYQLADKTRKEYNFKIEVNYGHDVSLKLVDNSYYGEVSLVDGELLRQRLNDLCIKYNITPTIDDMSNMVQALKNINVPELKSINLDVPLSKLTLRMPLYKFQFFVEV